MWVIHLFYCLRIMHILYSLIVMCVLCVSLAFRELSEIFFRNLCIAEIVRRIRISSWNFACTPKAMLWIALGTRTKFQLEILTIYVISGIVYFREIYTRETLVKQQCGCFTTQDEPSKNLCDVKYSLMWSYSLISSIFCVRNSVIKFLTKL